MKLIFECWHVSLLFVFFCSVSNAYSLHAQRVDKVLNDHADGLIDFCSKHIDEYLLSCVDTDPEGLAELLDRKNINFSDVFLHCLRPNSVQSVGANSDVDERRMRERAQQKYHKNQAYQENFPSYHEQFDTNLKQYKNGFADGWKFQEGLLSFFKDLALIYYYTSSKNPFYKFGFSRGRRERILKLKRRPGNQVWAWLTPH
ncbi:hypothetical protein IPH25_00395 [bacterium]|nr:MAG: hypothetical protein IPG37_02510 [bacterium]QQR61893.1 MAG: hypothetical protein IPH25_00395 [bacterium]QQR62521.1 MAG: hypothetical protein IPH67_03815 [bacterium]